MPAQGATGSVSKLLLFVNGRKVEVKDPDPELTLLEFLRRKRLTGSKLGCGEGGCGACTVMVSRYNDKDDVIEHYPVNACLAPLCGLHGQAVTTVEGIGSIRGKLHPVQRHLAMNHGSQCGFCTPGIIMSMYTLLRNNSCPTREEIQETFDGNLCRCTGYRPILEGFSAFALKNTCPMGEACCQNGVSRSNGDSNGGSNGYSNGDSNGGSNGGSNGDSNGDSNGGSNGDSNHDTEVNGTTSLLYDSTQEPIFPPELKLYSAQLHHENLHFKSDRVTWLSPFNLAELLAMRRNYPGCKLVNGNTEIGIETKFKRIVYPVLVSVTRVPELMEVCQTQRGIQIGSALPLTKVNVVLKAAIASLPEHKTRVFSAVVEMLKWFAGHQIRSVACLAGNIMTASPISDLNPLLLACKAVLHVADADGNMREVVMNENFFTGYRQTCLNSADTLVSVTVPFTRPNEYFFGYKQANRKEDDIAIVNAGMRVDLGKSGTHIQDISLAFGGMSVTTVLATKTMKALIGRPWNDALLETACCQDMLPSEMPLSPGSPGGMVAYRRTLTLSFFYRFYCAVSQRTQQISQLASPDAVSDIPLGLSTGSQVYHPPTDSQTSRSPVGRPIVHKSAFKQTSGEATYVDDIPVTDGELFAGFVMSPKAHAKILHIDASEAVAMPGVVDFITHRDVPGNNNWEGEHESVFACNTVQHDGQLLGVVLADSLAVAQRAASLVKVQLQDLQPIITIQDAIAQKSFIQHPPQVIQCGDVSEGFSLADHIVEGEFHLEAQEHFYLEPHACIVYPRDTGDYHVVCMTQGLDSIQMQVATVLGIPASQVNVSVRRIGGGFGGKETRHASVVLPVAVAAFKTQRPVRAVLDRCEDLRLTGTRHPILAKYKVGFTKHGRFVALEATVYFNCGMSKDLSASVSERCLLTMGNAYNIPHVYMTSVLCRTNIPSCTAFRGFGSPQAVAIMENIVEHVATTLGIPADQVQALNFYKQGDTTAYGQVIQQSTLPQCWEECLRLSDYATRLQNVQDFNRSSRWKKKGISVVPLTYGIGFPLKLLNQGTAVINVYKDGSVLLLLGGVEMGQGLHTKMIQVASQVLEIPDYLIHVPDSSTNSTPNAAPTAGSMTSDLLGMAVLKACEEVKRRIEPYKSANPKKDWTAVVQDAITDRTCMTVVGYYRADTAGMDWSKLVNSPFQYFSFGAACTEVEIDCLTGDHQVLRTDIVMDVGHSLNPAIDVGQIEGAFIQGYGMLVLEQYKVSGQGKLLTSGPGNYKIPAFSNIPQEFNVTLLKNKGNPRAVYSSKAIGEPPLCLAISVFLAIKSAITSARTDAGHTGHFQLDSPSTPDRIRMSCIDQFSQQFLADDEKDSVKPWFVKL